MQESDSRVRLLQEYVSRINMVLDYIEEHAAAELTLDELAEVAGFSKYHFHRIFSSFTGETLFQFIQRLRLERAAAVLGGNPGKAVSDIAYDCGFGNPSSFAKSFKKQFGISASAWRAQAGTNGNFGKARSNIRQVISKHGKEIEQSCVYTEYINNAQVWRIMMNNETRTVEVKQLPEMTVAYVRYVGPYKGNEKLFAGLFEKLYKWAGARNLLNFPETKTIIIYHDNPHITDESKLRTSVCVTVPQATAVDGEIGKTVIPAGKYALARFVLTPPEYEEAWNWFYGVWLPGSGYTCDERPCFELYHDNGDERGAFTVDLCLPVVPL